jgi:hypothetical protein
MTTKMIGHTENSNAQLSLWDVEESEQPVKMDELDSLYIWKLAVSKFDTKRWREGWRPWRKGA